MHTNAFQRFLILGTILAGFILPPAHAQETVPQPPESQEPRRILLHGKVVQKDGSAKKRYVYIEDGVIQSVTYKRPKLLKGIRFVHEAGYIYPGLIDLHTHITYNIMPVWGGAQSQFSNRFEWRKNEDYKNFRDIYKALTIPDFKFGLLLYDEIQALAGGTTLIQESGIIDNESKDVTRRLVVRGTDFEDDLELNNGKKVASSFEIFAPKADGTFAAKDALESFAKRRSEDKLQAYIVHLAEGRTGFLRTDQSFDPSCRAEFETLMAHPYFSDPENTPKPPVALIHSSGIDPQNDAHINFLKTWNMGIVWSLVSNLLLYGDTLDIPTLLQKGVLIALGSDWSPSGSKHVLDEARMARFYLDMIAYPNPSPVSDAEIFQMMTTNAAQMIDHPRLGGIKPGNLADLFVIEDPDPSVSPMKALFYTDVKYITMVMIRGRAVYGYEDRVRPLEPNVQLLPQIEGEPVLNKVVYMDPALNLNLEETIGKMEAHLKTLGVYRNNLLTSTDKPYQERMFQLQQMIFNTFLAPRLKKKE
ncbi:MAG: amidohydrolase family protein [Deltaproteobacteria bacterium]|nr:amidohydrolase family protein [Deltaproteobacteria bacterium]